MRSQQTRLLTQTIFSRPSLLLRLATLLSGLSLAACASAAHKDDSIESILKKENVVISKVKVERSEPTLCALLNGTSEMTEAEKHLSEALDAITRSNEVITQKLLSERGKENEIERHNP
jgi:hypothetical protein